VTLYLMQAVPSEKDREDFSPYLSLVWATNVRLIPPESYSASFSLRYCTITIPVSTPLGMSPGLALLPMG
jgi:hypothetical protein